MSIKVSNISKYYGKQLALDNVSFEISKGEVVGFLGPNGAGKTTMMKIITCFLPPSSGDAWVCGYDIMNESLDVRKRVGYLPENNPLYYDMYVREYLEFIAGIYRIGDETARQINEMINITGLSQEQHKKIGALSKGFRQRVGLAQAMIHDPEVLIFDEPTSGLDPNQLLEIRNLIKEIGKEKTVMLSTHIMQEVEAVCDRVIIIDNGKIVADDLTDNLSRLSSGNTLITVEFNNKIDEKLLGRIRGIEEIKYLRSNIWQLQSKTGVDIRPEVFKFAVQNNLTVLSMQKEEQRLEKVFQQLTKKI